jgi:hypothetical protein
VANLHDRFLRGSDAGNSGNSGGNSQFQLHLHKKTSRI